MLRKLILSRKAANNLDIKKDNTARENMGQLAAKKAALVLVKSIFVEMYQKQTTVTAIFSNNFMALESFDSFFFWVIPSSFCNVVACCAKWTAKKIKSL